jgi:hypothetical protein
MIEPMLTDPAEAERRPSAAQQLAARVAGHAHCTVLLCTLHIGGANLKIRATCDSRVLPRSPTDVHGVLTQVVAAHMQRLVNDVRSAAVVVKHLTF